MAQGKPPANTLAERDAAKYVNYSASYLRTARLTNRGPAFIRIGRSIRYYVKDLDTWLRAHRVATRECR